MIGEVVASPNSPNKALCRLLGLAFVLAAGLLGLVGSADARPKPVSPNISSVTCTSAISGGVHGTASCWGGLYGGSARIIVVCSAWWDPNVTGNWVYIKPGERKGSQDGLAGDCYSPVESVTTETK